MPNDPDPADEKNQDAAAKDAARQFANDAGSFFTALDQRHKVYLIALAITLLCSVLFGAYKVNVSGAGGMAAFAESMLENASSRTSPSLLSLGSGKGAFGGKLAFLGALAGVGILIWSASAKRRDPWVPLALAGSAGLATLGILITRLGTGGGGSNEMIKVSVDGTLFGWWLPFLAAAAATFVSVQRILKA